MAEGHLWSGRIAGTTADPDLAVLLAQAREHSLSLYGPKASDVLEPVPMADLRKAIHESLPGLWRTSRTMSGTSF